MRARPRKLVHYRLPEDLVERLAARARAERTTRTALVERAVRTYLGRPSRKER